jgi:hypothetical protein
MITWKEACRRQANKTNKEWKQAFRTGWFDASLDHCSNIALSASSSQYCNGYWHRQNRYKYYNLGV